jgi:hypothetical protein
MTTDAQGSRVVLTADGSEPDKLSDLVHQVAYLNTREFPSPGKRIVQLATTLQCMYVIQKIIGWSGVGKASSAIKLYTLVGFCYYCVVVYPCGKMLRLLTRFRK